MSSFEKTTCVLSELLWSVCMSSLTQMPCDDMISGKQMNAWFSFFFIAFYCTIFFRINIVSSCHKLNYNYLIGILNIFDYQILDDYHESSIPILHTAIATRDACRQDDEETAEWGQFRGLEAELMVGREMERNQAAINGSTGSLCIWPKNYKTFKKPRHWHPSATLVGRVVLIRWIAKLITINGS